MKAFIRRKLPSIILLALIAILVVIISMRIAVHSQEKEQAPLQDELETPEIEETSVAEVATPEAKKPQIKEPQIAEAPVEEPPEPVKNIRYADIAMSDEERELMAKVIYLEAGNQSAEGQQAVAEVIFNRVIHSGFPNNITDVLWEKGQFSVMPNLSYAAPGKAQYDAIDGALYGNLILDADVVFFSRGAENDRIWGKIGDHVFCREYIWR